MVDADEALMRAIDPWIIGSFGCADAARGIRAALAEAGYVIVPREPTEAMLAAGYVASWPDVEVLSDCWRAMVAAAAEKDADPR